MWNYFISDFSFFVHIPLLSLHFASYISSFLQYSTIPSLCPITYAMDYPSLEMLLPGECCWECQWMECLLHSFCWNVADTNQELLLSQEGLTDQMLLLLTTCTRGHGKALKVSILELLFTISQTAHGRTLLITHFNSNR